MRKIQFFSYLVANDEGPMKVFFCDLLVKGHQGEKSVKEQCSLAFATTFFGVAHAHGALVCEGRRLYLQALRAVNAMLNDPARNRSIEALGSVVALCLYEVRISDGCRLSLRLTSLLLGDRTNTKQRTHMGAPHERS
jgi:hypothetical protein